MKIERFRRNSIRFLSARFHRDERGAALTEMVMTLPVWIIMLAGIISLGKLGMNTTANQLETQTVLWDRVFDASTGSDAKHMSPIIAGGDAMIEDGKLAAKGGNPHKFLDIADGVVMGPVGGLELNGTLGESNLRATPLVGGFADGLSASDLKSDPNDIIEDGSPYTIKVIHDGGNNSEFDFSTDGGWFSTIAGVIGGLASASGLTHSWGAGIRYGAVYSETVGTEIDLIFGMKVNASSHGNLLVAPNPMSGDEAEWKPFLLNRLLAGGESNYSVMMRFGESEWDDEGGSSSYTDQMPSTDRDDMLDEGEDAADMIEKCNGDEPPGSCDAWCNEPGNEGLCSN